MRVFYTTDAHGHYLGSVVISVGDSKAKAKREILKVLKEEFPDMAESELSSFTVEEMKTETKVIWNGDY